MKLGINGWRIHGQRTGIGRYLFNVIRHWTADAVAGRFDVSPLVIRHQYDNQLAEIPGAAFPS